MISSASAAAPSSGASGRRSRGSAIRVLGELDIINAYERIRAYYLNIAETLAGGKR